MCGGHTTSCLLAVVDGRGLVLDASWIVLNIENAAITDTVLFPTLSSVVCHIFVVQSALVQPYSNNLYLRGGGVFIPLI